MQLTYVIVIVSNTIEVVENTLTLVEAIHSKQYN